MAPSVNWGIGLVPEITHRFGVPHYRSRLWEMVMQGIQNLGPRPALLDQLHHYL